ncbi:hypothetical protein SRB5_63200 [Streptomyces sp. RB5]|uniref:Uncharacterized protein n=1 Tax=Streptomyces smaragdinus TaxID=2585196 RepID=A0A7K0CRK6_9ACTN|nr:helix-turn-helix domain-containing protein [Streptomyces smaragdinus]MQY16128.1 hypothetical protein [Streptomyces smaragdinus]
MNAITPGPLPADVLTRDDVRRALGEHDFGAAFRLFKKYGGLSQNRIASACVLTPGKVSNIVSGQQRIESYAVICRIADGLRIPGHLLGLASRPWETGKTQPGPDVEQRAGSSAEVVWQPDTVPAMASRLTRSDLVMDRRAATRALAAGVVTGPALLDSLDGWLTPSVPKLPSAARRGRLSLQEVEELEATARVFRTWSHRFGGRLRRKAVLGLLDEIAAALAEHQQPEVQQRLYATMAQLAGTAASMSWDSGMQHAAQGYYRLALRAAHAAGDAPFGANILAGMARQLLFRDRPADALELVRLAQEGSRTTAGPRLKAMLATREAWAYAAMGRTSAFKRTTDRAAETLTNAKPGVEPYWINYFDQAELDGVTGGRFLDLARVEPRRHAEAAAEKIHSALAARGLETGRGHVLDRIGLAECHFLRGDLTAAATCTRAAVEVAGTTQSQRVRDQLTYLYPYTVGNSAPTAVREVRDLLRTQLAEGKPIP